MREYEMTVVFDLAIAETGGNDAAPSIVTQFVEGRGGKVLKHDHWGRRRMAYPINHALDADYVVSRIEVDPATVAPLEAALTIDERVYRYLIVRADELPPPPPPREPREPRGERAAPPAEPAPAVVEAPAAPAEAVATEVPAEAGEPAAPEAEPEPATAEAPAEAPAEAEELAAEAEAATAGVESPPTEADAAAEAGTEDEAPSA